jgi:hypothetical protein
MLVTVNGDLCNSAYNDYYPNKPCVSVTICNPNTTTCDTITDILLDTGSTGLRIFKDALTNTSLSTVTTSDTSYLLGSCAAFGDGSLDWGPVKIADVIIGSETAPSINIQIIDKTWGDGGTACNAAWGPGYTLDTGSYSGKSPAYFNGILGVGVDFHNM